MTTQWRSNLSSYLNDHLSGSAAGVQLVRHLVTTNKGTELERELAPFLSQFEQERGHVKELMTRLELSEDRLRQAFGWASEMVARVGLDRRVTRSVELSRLLQLELLSIAIEGKASMWRALQHLADRHEAIRNVPAKRLEEQAEAQRAVVERHRLWTLEQAVPQP